MSDAVRRTPTHLMVQLIIAVLMIMRQVLLRTLLLIDQQVNMDSVIRSVLTQMPTSLRA